MQETLFGHLVQRFSSSPENLATESLAFILNRSTVAMNGFRNLLSTYQITIPASITIETQSTGADASTPDMVGKDNQGNILFLGETKFWAGLTDNQPVSYLHRLMETGGQALVVISPEIRMPTLWAELIHRVAKAELLYARPTGDETNRYQIVIETQVKMILVSWRMILNAIRHQLENENEVTMLSNLDQLRGLCDRMDTTAFLPLTSEEITGTAPRRIQQYYDIIDEVIEKLRAEKIASLGGYKATGSRVGYCRYMKIANQACQLAVFFFLWDQFYSTPFWFGLVNSAWNYDPVAREKLKSYEYADPPRLFVQDKYIYIPLIPLIGVEKDTLVNDLIQQIKDVMSHLQ
jgi:hypothetical protein